MVVIYVELVPPRLRGGLTRWLTEVAAGLFVGRVSTLVRELLWASIVEEAADTGRAVMVHRANNEQGYLLTMHGDSKRTVVELDGLLLVANRHAAWTDWIADEHAED